MLDRFQTLTWGNKCLFEAYDPSDEIKLRRWELNLTHDDFLRFKKVYQNGKQEYYSVSLRRFKDMDYLGTTTRGILRIKTQTDDIIVQTYNDPKGNVDSMTTTLIIPVKNMEAERLDSLYTALNFLKIPTGAK
ncbi:hypothetical protein [Mucilaginibacter sp. PAMB04168]|uniref:hypothetical protein n=1 Tax=Mucilaginibacter sp. PAMB04168 TaxID=3138567 RepID=UPI0031F605C5